MVAGFISERWPASRRNTRPASIGICSKALFCAIKCIDALPDQEQYRADREAMSRLLDNLDDTRLGERHRVIRQPAKASVATR